MRLSRRWWLFLLGAVFLLSGFTSLVLEVLWTQRLSNVIGATSAAATCALSVLVVCLSLGSLLAFRFRIDGRPALALHGRAELFIGLPTPLLGTTFPLLMNAVRAAGEGMSIFDSLQAYDDE